MHYLLLFILFSINLMATDKPNVVIILTDDLGWGDVSYHGSHIPTPNIDQLAKDGMELNRFYSNLALNTIIEKDLESDEAKILEYFEIYNI